MAERQFVEFKNPGDLQRVLDDFLAMMAEEDSQAALKDREFADFARATKRLSLIRGSLNKSREAGWTDHGYSKGQYGKIAVDPDDLEAIMLAIFTAGDKNDQDKLAPEVQAAISKYPHHQQMGAARRSMPVPSEDLFGEGLSGRGAEGFGGHGEGFEVQNQGVTRRAPGEGPEAFGGPEGYNQFPLDDFPNCATCDGTGCSGVDDACPDCNGVGVVIEGAIEDMKKSVRGMKHVVGRMGARLAKSSEKEKKEHPWMSDKEAIRVAKDHMKEARMVQVFRMREAAMSPHSSPICQGCGRPLEKGADKCGACGYPVKKD